MDEERRRRADQIRTGGLDRETALALRRADRETGARLSADEARLAGMEARIATLEATVAAFTAAFAALLDDTT